VSHFLNYVLNFRDEMDEEPAYIPVPVGGETISSLERHLDEQDEAIVQDEPDIIVINNSKSIYFKIEKKQFIKLYL